MELCHGMGQSDEPKEAGIEHLKIVKGGCHLDPEVCGCRCHTVGPNEYAGHPAACCNKCRYCGKNIVLDLHESHEEKCREEKYIAF